ncbi:hypothetical protein V3C99_017511 [Haemonchus contortus]
MFPSTMKFAYGTTQRSYTFDRLLYPAIICMIAICTVQSRDIPRELQAFGCRNPEITNSMRSLFLNFHNDARLRVAKGVEPNRYGYLHPAKNMYKLQWDCNLEQKAQNLIAGCPQWMRMAGGMSRNFFTTYIRPKSNTSDIIAGILSKWWGEASVYGVSDPENKYTNTILYNFANMVHSSTTGIGCAYKVCDKSRLTVMCLYNKIGYIFDRPMWETGSACRSASECTTYPGSSCSDGLCIKGLEPPDYGYNTICPSNADMTDAVRRKFLEMHNYLRSRVAKGLEKDAMGGNAPKASKMLKMVYDCNVEASAIRHSRKCVYQHSTWNDRPGMRENIYSTSILNVDKINVAEVAVAFWWDELKKYGIGPANRLTNELMYRPNKEIAHYTQMAWDRTFKLGCSVQHCPSFSYAVCHYSPAGNNINEMIYTIGDPCKVDQQCPGRYTCSPSEGLCNVA